MDVSGWTRTTIGAVQSFRMNAESLNLAVNAVADVLHGRKHRDRLVLNNMAMLTLTAMRRYDPRGMLTGSLLTYHSELTEAHGKVNGMKSLCTGSGLKSGV